MKLKVLRIIAWKCVIFRKRHWVMTVLEFLSPCVVFALLISLHVKYVKKIEDNALKTRTNASNFPPLKEEYFSGCFLKDYAGPITVAYAPKNSFTENIIASLQKAFPAVKTNGSVISKFKITFPIN